MQVLGCSAQTGGESESLFRMSGATAYERQGKPWMDVKWAIVVTGHWSLVWAWILDIPRRLKHADAARLGMERVPRSTSGAARTRQMTGAWDWC